MSIRFGAKYDHAVKRLPLCPGRAEKRGEGCGFGRGIPGAV